MSSHAKGNMHDNEIENPAGLSKLPVTKVLFLIKCEMPHTDKITPVSKRILFIFKFDRELLLIMKKE
ncbi:hypothetical protein JCM17136A_04960 [Phocaeicola sartorii JCM 17136 = DSM 21941]